MFDPGSRYAKLETAVYTVTGPDGSMRQIGYVRRRFVPKTAGATLVEHTVSEGDRLDNIAARYIGDPTQFWRIADSNGAIRPEELTEEVGRRLRITSPGL